ncbi:hypothetical protein P3S68_023420 [Capsicum galapagoense]
MNILSEIWLQSLSTLYIFRLKIWEVEIPMETFELYYSVSSEVFLLIDKWLDIALQNGVKIIVSLPFHQHLPIFTILAAKFFKRIGSEVLYSYACLLSNSVSLSPKVEYGGDGCFIGCVVLLREKVGVAFVEDKMREVRTKKGCKLGYRVDWKKYLLVLDEVWNKDNLKWARLKNMLVGGTKGSKILLTTHSDVVAEEEVGVSTVCELGD